MGKGDNRKPNKEPKKPKKDAAEKKVVAVASTRAAVPVVARRPPKDG